METAPCHVLGLSVLSSTSSGSDQNMLGMQKEPLTESSLELHLQNKKGEVF